MNKRLVYLIEDFLDAKLAFFAALIDGESLSKEKVQDLLAGIGEARDRFIAWCDANASAINEEGSQKAEIGDDAIAAKIIQQYRARVADDSHE